MKLPTAIPKSILAPLSNGTWKSDAYSLDKFALCIKSHAADDQASGLTCKQSHDGSGLTCAEFAAIVAEGAINPVFHDGDYANQHWEHSLEQFYAEATKSWQAHLARTDALIGTPAGRISSSKEDITP